MKRSHAVQFIVYSFDSFRFGVSFWHFCPDFFYQPVSSSTTRFLFSLQKPNKITLSQKKNQLNANENINNIIRLVNDMYLLYSSVRVEFSIFEELSDAVYGTDDVLREKRCINRDRQ